jgi:glycosyltransferase involved in cell wall biosynthesis
MNQAKHFISVIIPVFNGEDYLEEAVESVRLQNHEPLEILIIDDGSTDNTANLASGLLGNIRYFYQPNSGPPTARNRGLRMARGDVIAFLDADDLWAEDKLEIQLSFLRKDPSVGIVLGHTQLVRHMHVKEGVRELEKLSHPWPAMSLGSMIVQKSVFERVGFFDEGQFFADDCDWFLRAKELGIKTIIHQEVTQFYRRHQNNITNQRELDRKYFIATLKKSLDRRRVEDGSVKSLPGWFTKKTP